MEQFGGISRKCLYKGRRAICGALCVFLLLSSSGCGVADSLNKTRNSLLEFLGIAPKDNYGPRVDPNTIIDPFDPDYIPQDYVPNVYPEDTEFVWGIPEPGTEGPSNPDGESPTTPSAQDTSGELKVDPGRFIPTVNPVATADIYNSYLSSKVYTPIANILNDLPLDSRNRIYFRVFNYGQEYDADDRTCSPGRVYDSSCIGTSQSYGGTAMPTFVAGWLGQIQGNANNIESARTRWLSEINYSSLDEDTNWLEASTRSGGNPKLVLMWGNERTGLGSLKDYISIVKDQAIGVIPDITFRMYTSLTHYTTVTINPTAGQLGGLHYKDAMQKVDLDYVFTKQNQFVTRSCSVIDKTLLDDSSILSCYLDGYNKMLIYIAVERGYTLQEVLGVSYSEVAEIIRNAARPNDGAGLQSALSELTMVPAGVKGTG